MAQQVSAPTTSWAVVRGAGNNPLTDPNNDQQTGSGGAGGEADLVSSQGPDFSNPLLYAAFDRGSLSNLTDGTLFFRARLGQSGGNNPPAARFDRALFVYLFADANDSIDLVVGVNNVNERVGLWLPGTGANTSPNTTSIAALTVNPQGSNPYTYPTPTPGVNYQAQYVTPALQPGVTNTDADGDGNTDIFVSFSVSFADVTAQLQKQGFATNENTAFRYVLATATQENSLNQDIGGVGSLNNQQQQQTYTQLGAVTAAASPASFAAAAAVVPEPGTIALTMLPLAGGIAGRALRHSRGGRTSRQARGKA